MSIVFLRTPLAVLALSIASGAAAQDISLPLAQQRGGTFIVPPDRVDPIYLPLGPSRLSSGAAAPAGMKLTLRLTLDLPLRGPTGNVGHGVQGAQPTASTAQATVRWAPVAGQPWFGQVTFYRYLRYDHQQPWDPDFSYGFGYDNARPGSFSLLYANYAGNRLGLDTGANGRRFNFSSGQWSLGYGFELPEWLAPVFLTGGGDDALCRANLNYTARYIDVAGGADHRGKKSASLSCRYTHPQGWFAHASAFAYPQSSEQPWDPDFTYSFGVAGGPIAPFTLQYSNFSGNRWPGRSRFPGQGSFYDGRLSLSWVRDW